jgi:hypothetical protein
MLRTRRPFLRVRKAIVWIRHGDYRYFLKRAIRVDSFCVRIFSWCAFADESTNTKPRNHTNQDHEKEPKDSIDKSGMSLPLIAQCSETILLSHEHSASISNHRTHRCAGSHYSLSQTNSVR